MRKTNEAFPNNKLKAARESHRWTQEELAEQLGTTSVTISRWESGVTFPGRYFRRKLSSLFEMSISELGLDLDLNEPYNKNEQRNNISGFTSHTSSLSILPFLDTEESVFPDPIFLFNVPLLRPQELYGRRRERELLLNRTYHRASTSIVGPRRSGKTWLIEYLLHTAPQELGARYVCRYIDATTPSCGTVNGFASEVLEAFGLSTTKVNEEGLLALEKGLKMLKSRRIVPVLCIDEFERLTNRHEFSNDFFRGLRAITQAYSLVLIVVTRRPLSQIMHQDLETSGFFNIFETLLLGPFNRDEASRFIQEKSEQANFTKQEIDFLWKYGKTNEHEWPPLRLQLVGQILLWDRNESKDDQFYDQNFEQRLEELYHNVVY